ncbi:MAG: Spo0B domain-containing protein [Streptosporangiales bacterium]|nr:Spo0B domain-containing protein [Streptosporangiales bacterium]MBO0890635.1 Spo0B domain-containing protein [Acidothermales bacterium]
MQGAREVDRVLLAPFIKGVNAIPRIVLASVVNVDRGTLGESARGKVPLRDAGGNVVGEVSVGIAISRVGTAMRLQAFQYGLLLAGALLIGATGTALIVRRLRRHTWGLQPEEIADLLRDHTAVVEGVRDGVVAVDADGRVTVCNEEAGRLLGRTLRRGDDVRTAGLSPAAVALFTDEPPPDNAMRPLGDRVVRALRVPVERDGRHLGAVLTLRDRSDLDQLGREREATRALIDALRAQAHEYTNRLHLLTGLLGIGHADEAREYLTQLRTEAESTQQLVEPYLDGLLAAKSALASEQGVRLELSGDSMVTGRLSSPLDVVTVVGNLLDNAVTAAARGDRGPAKVEVDLLSSGDDLHVQVRDSGRGVPAEHVGDLFAPGYTTRDDGDGRHGLGLVLARQTARRRGGDVVLTHAGDATRGATFTAVLPGVVSTRPARPQVQETVR